MAASGTLSSPVLGLTRVDLGEGPWTYQKAVDVENALNRERDLIDAMTGFLTASCYTMFQISGSAADNLGDAGGLGAEYNRVTDRVIQEVVAFAATSGSGGVSTIDIQIQQGPGGNFSSIFGPGGSSNNVFKSALSSSLGNYGISKVSNLNFVSGSNMVWPKGTLLRAVLTTAAGTSGVGGQKGLIVQVFWSPSGSFANRTAHP